MEAMCSAAAEGDLPELQRLLMADPGLATSTLGALGVTPLFCAAANGRVEAVQLLLEAAPAASLTVRAASRCTVQRVAGAQKPCACCWSRRRRQLW